MDEFEKVYAWDNYTGSRVEGYLINTSINFYGKVHHQVLIIDDNTGEGQLHYFKNIKYVK